MELLASGRDADVFVLDGSRVLRRCRDRETRCERMAAMMELARESGFPVPRVYAVDGPDVVLERLHGPTMLAAVLEGTVSADAAAAVMVDLHASLHAVPVPADVEAGLALCHLDLHPDNVLLDDRGPVLIDWSNSRFARPGFDVALTAVIIAQVAVDDGHPLSERARTLLDAFLGLAGRLGVRDIDDALADRASNVTMSSHEVALLPRCAELLTAGDRG